MQILSSVWLEAHPLPRMDQKADKEERGRVLIIGGSRQCPGAVLLAGMAALRAGAGKLRLATLPSLALPLAMQIPEGRAFPYLHPARLDRLVELASGAQAALLGPGLLNGKMTRRLLETLLPVKTPLVLDALALRVADLDSLQGRAGPTILTPHPGEMEALGSDDPHEIARRANAVVVKKGRTTVVVSPEGDEVCNQDGHVGLATSGSGDVLAGLIAGLAARGTAPWEAAAWGVSLHARAGERLGPPGFLARDLLEPVPTLLHGFH